MTTQCETIILWTHSSHDLCLTCMVHPYRSGTIKGTSHFFPYLNIVQLIWLMSSMWEATPSSFKLPTNLHWGEIYTAVKRNLIQSAFQIWLNHSSQRWVFVGFPTDCKTAPSEPFRLGPWISFWNMCRTQDALTRCQHCNVNKACISVINLIDQPVTSGLYMISSTMPPSLLTGNPIKFLYIVNQATRLCFAAWSINIFILVLSAK